MISSLTRGLRGALAWGLLAAVGVVLVCAFALLLKDGASFADKSAFFGYLWVHPVYVGLVVLAVALASAGEPSARARVVAVVAAGLLGLMLAMGLLTWISALASDDGDSVGFAGIPGAGKVVGTLLGLAFIALTALAGWFAVSVARMVPPGSSAAHPGGGWPVAHAPQPAQYGQPAQYPQQAPYGQQPAGSYPQQYAPYGYPYGYYTGEQYQQTLAQPAYGYPGQPYSGGYGEPAFPSAQQWSAQQWPTQPPAGQPPSGGQPAPPQATGQAPSPGRAGATAWEGAPPERTASPEEQPGT